MSADDHTEQVIKRLRPEWAQLMANLVLRGWVIRPVSDKTDRAMFGHSSWTAHLTVETAEQLDVAMRHKDLHGLRMYSAPSLLSLLQQMRPVLDEFVAIEQGLVPPPDAASSFRNRTTYIEVKPGAKKPVTVSVTDIDPPPR